MPIQPINRRANPIKKEELKNYSTNKRRGKLTNRK
jgi:hypothetical protein